MLFFEHLSPSVGSWRPKFDVKHFECHKCVIRQQGGNDNQNVRHPKRNRLNQMIVHVKHLSVPKIEEIVGQRRRHKYGDRSKDRRQEDERLITSDEPQFQIHHEHDHVNHECAVIEEIGCEWRRQNRIILVPHDVADEIDDQRMIH